MRVPKRAIPCLPTTDLEPTCRQYPPIGSRSIIRLDRGQGVGNLVRHREDSITNSNWRQRVATEQNRDESIHSMTNHQISASSSQGNGNGDEYIGTRRLDLMTSVS
eukprot:CAMPEP_0194412958 /NCGR_PEP_ID=MMETSP0176-20130528/11427_1 /TAXON_ID=216777 /ORGANISM="Proboscia alata, Strain PI-D3" /LENGTH=105 /DNA_ID=CAMNT_0039215997 /DNA_START=452 /DNA_END=765 /DNA_ORIENTATION=-